jgi:hypothetical protein
MKLFMKSLLIETILNKAKEAGAVEPVVGDMNGEACIVDIDNGNVYHIILEQVNSD